MAKTRQKIDILGRCWRVHFVRKKIFDKDGVECDGHADQDKHLIHISLNLAKDRQRSTLLHELLHAIIDTTTAAHPNDEERCVQAMESGLFAVLRSTDNAWLLNFILEVD